MDWTGIVDHNDQECIVCALSMDTLPVPVSWL